MAAAWRTSRPVTKASRPRRGASAVSAVRNAAGTTAAYGSETIGEMVPSMSQKSAVARGSRATA